MLTLFLLGAVGFALFLAHRFYKLRREHGARYASPPERIFLEVKLPADMKDGQVRMQKFYRIVKDATSADPTLRREGKRQLEILYLIEVPQGEITPIMTTYIICDPDRASLVKRALRGAFQGQAYFKPVKAGDPLADVLEALIAQEVGGPESAAPSVPSEPRTG